MQSKKCKIINTILEMRHYIKSLRTDGMTIGLVPTMGNLHEGHSSLIKESRKKADITIVTIFVNPTQFNSQEDLEKYPKTLENDLKECEKNSVDAIFIPSNKEMYSSENIFTVMPPKKYSEILCGKYRPGHFEGVATIVTKLFNIIQADIAFFGQKDAQQLFIIKKLIENLNIPIQINSCPTIREKDGLAMSSRNSHLNKNARSLAPKLYKLLSFIENEYKKGNKNFEQLKKISKSNIIDQYEDIHLEYVYAYDYNTLKKVKELKPNTLIALAAFIGGVRLIDNIILS